MVTPLILVLLWWYGGILESEGPRVALRRMYGLVLGVFVLGWGWLVVFEIMISSSDSNSSSSGEIAVWCTKAIVACLFVFQNSYGHLLYNQHWSFLGSVTTPTEGSTWFTSIAGLSSIVCTLTASSVRSIASSSSREEKGEGEGEEGSGVGGLTTLLFLTCITIALSGFCADWAYSLAHEHGFDPSLERTQQQQTNTTNTNSSDDRSKQHKSILTKTTHLFQTSPLLTTLFLETITFQSLSTTLDLHFIRQLKKSFPRDDGRRASTTGRFYGAVNAATALVQFGILPMMRRWIEPKVVYRILPVLVVPVVVYAGYDSHSSFTTFVFAFSSSFSSWIGIDDEGLYKAGLAFFILKTLDYGLRHVSQEMVYQPLDFDARYLGKEVIGVFANRVGKSGMSMVLSGLTSSAMTLGSGGVSGVEEGREDEEEMRMLGRLAVVAAIVWSICSLVLSRYVVSNRRAEERVRERECRRRRREHKEEEEEGDDDETTDNGIITDEDDDLSNDTAAAAAAAASADGCRESTTTTTTTTVTTRMKED